MTIESLTKIRDKGQPPPQIVKMLKYIILLSMLKSGLHKLCQPASLAVRKWRENEKMKRKWRENEEMERKWREN